MTRGTEDVAGSLLNIRNPRELHKEKVSQSRREVRELSARLDFLQLQNLLQTRQMLYDERECTNKILQFMRARIRIRIPTSVIF